MSRKGRAARPGGRSGWRRWERCAQRRAAVVTEGGAARLWPTKAKEAAAALLAARGGAQVTARLRRSGKVRDRSRAVPRTPTSRDRQRGEGGREGGRGRVGRERSCVCGFTSRSSSMASFIASVFGEIVFDEKEDDHSSSGPNSRSIGPLEAIIIGGEGRR